MIKKKKAGRIVIDLDGPNGNAFVLLGMAKSWAKQLKLDWAEIHKEATSADYRKIVLTLDKYFGEVVDFTTQQDYLLNIDEAEIVEIEVDSNMKKMGY